MNYREFMNKGECLLNAILRTVILGLHLFLFLYIVSDFHPDLKSIWYAIILLALDVAALAVRWHRYLAYNKKVVKDE